MTVNNSFSEVLNGRKSIKLFDENYKIPHEEMEEMIRKATMAPSSVNLQPWRFVVVESDEGKDKLRPLVQFNTNQNDTSSAMIVIFGDKESHENSEFIYSQAVENDLMPADVKEQLLSKINEVYQTYSEQKINDVVKIDSSLAAMQFMLVAKEHGYDTNPIGGFEEDQIAEALGLDSERYVPVVIIAVGKAAREARASYRMPVDKVMQYV
ncbi:nitroreductase family protein [Staphylococcus kloosii]|uniref:NAD(P)H nitroreductase n=1 Tax=Staphylococcus kloosii TaxID=29384 RepID=A0A151A2H0_9STAP|nr:nitroreductase family protein [Staphylococcus kloosii]AVQ35133.1 nitroreductase family protein [Staphylococcus kloosii]KYH13621.1 NAD(P)H nitroreductase [Staphylococcus kloosii]MBF7021068.1 nitroreductase family protein [Staphylococcus kloosii]MBF7030343.1 nitroreductase family protein [Staphylococcus kloosii]MCD8879603.1 nitroreductase family protein [Staphylococcus kloosii]